MAHLRVLWDNRFSTASLTASSEVTALPAAASQNPDRSYVFRSLTGTGTVELDIDLGSSQLVTAVAVANVKRVGSGRLDLYERGTGGSPGAATFVATLPAQDALTRVSVAFFAGVTARHLQLQWTNPGADSDYAELGYAFAGTYFEPDRNIAIPWPWRLVDPSVKRRSVDGQLTTTSRTAYRVGTWAFPFVSERERKIWVESIYATVGQRVPWFAVPSVTAPWLAMLVRFASDIGAQYERSVDEYGITFDWEEAR